MVRTMQEAQSARTILSRALTGHALTKGEQDIVFAYEFTTIEWQNVFAATHAIRIGELRANAKSNGSK